MQHTMSSIMLLSLAIGALLSSASETACLKDRSGEVICGRGPCLRDVNGEVLCARYRFGSILRTSDGQTVCGRGKCVTTLDGDVICSAIDGGGAVKQLDGSVRCEGDCETGSVELCERTPAGR
jgi:hypothetical protein